MKKTIVQVIIALVAIAAVAGTLEAAPPGKGSITGVHKSATVAQIDALKPGDQYAIVCYMCKSVTIKDVGEAVKVADLCKEDGMLACDGCKKKSTIKHKGPPGKKHPVYVDGKGEECMFIVPLKSKE